MTKQTVNAKKEKIRTPIARIIVGGISSPYYSIMYYDSSDGFMHIGFGSYDLSIVRKWFAEEFEVTGECNFACVTRCRDCANFRQNAHGVCWCDEYGGAITPNDYCSRAVSDKQPRASIPWEAD
ncbi:MAG: hypothetical protein SOX74_04815 [Candidatus Faecousia sp.]|uniref:hypothetical protein n=1 Tax=Faecousia sp. TaxID=2952921 RepID=UPI002A859157|nr:hypothetical protein [Candidatus Faecousia sp.]